MRSIIHSISDVIEAGTGKSVLLRHIIRDLKAKFSTDEMAVGVTASTGMAAVNISGVTLHYFAGFPRDVGLLPFERVKSKVKRNPGAKERWERLRVLIIDESAQNFHLFSHHAINPCVVSMIDQKMFDMIVMIGEHFGPFKGYPFGGIQVQFLQFRLYLCLNMLSL